VLRVRGNAAEVPGTYVPWLAICASTAPGEQSIKAQNRLGGSAGARGRSSGASWSATLDCSWGSTTSTGCSRRVDGTTRYLLDGLSVIAQYAPEGQRQAWYTQSLARIDEVLNVVSDSGKQWYQADALGSIYALTSATGALVATANYDVFGALVPAPSGPAGQPFGFTGREHELDSGLVYARARYLNPGTGRWDRADPVGQIGGPDYYLYAGANPITHSDPSGLMFSTTVDAYAVMYSVAFLLLLMDLGYSLPAQRSTTTSYDTRNRIARQLSTSGRRQPQPIPQLGPDVFCQPTPEEEDPWIVYYRGLSSRDLGEFQIFQAVLSNYQRDGLGSIGDGLIEALDPQTPVRHILSGSAGSPLVSVTTNLDVARRFANGGPNASGVVIKFETRRLPMWSGQMADSELLFFWQLGFDGERLSIYN
jgi:RHS repeat-associated protein